MKRSRSHDGSASRTPPRSQTTQPDSYQSTTARQTRGAYSATASPSLDSPPSAAARRQLGFELRESAGSVAGPLESSRNPFIQEVRRASSRGVATEEGLVVAEGPHLLSESLAGKWTLETVLVTAAARSRFSALLERCAVPVIDCSERAFEAASATEHSQGVLALLRPKVWEWPDLLVSGAGNLAPLVVLLDSLQDPGNAGAIIRSAEAFQASGIVLLAGSVQPANGKLLRAAAGSLFRIPFLAQVDRDEALARLAAAGCRLFGLVPGVAGTSTRPRDLLGVDLRPASALAVGNEGAGLSPHVAAQAQMLSIPTHGVESLNAAVACSIALFEASRQRNLREEPNGLV